MYRPTDGNNIIVHLHIYKTYYFPLHLGNDHGIGDVIISWSALHFAGRLIKGKYI